MGEPSLVVITEGFGPYMLRPQRPITVIVEHSPCFVMGRPNDDLLDRISTTPTISDTVEEVVNRFTMRGDTAQPAGVPIRLHLMGTVAWEIAKALLDVNDKNIIRPGRDRIFEALHAVKVVDVNGLTIEVQP